VLRFLPPYIIQKKHVDQLVKALDAALHKNAESNKFTDKSTHKKKSAPARRKEIHAHA
jgi:hypothetical protein